jgi:hypothetical protein
MVGAVGLTLKRPVSAPNVDVFAQHNVDFQKVLVQRGPSAPSRGAAQQSSSYLAALYIIFCSVWLSDRMLHFILYFFFSNENFSSKIAWKLVGSAHVECSTKPFYYLPYTLQFEWKL